eukprot:COSAG04_NODE_9596_length_849_cov_0.992000_1_plen_187_part_10
MGSANVLLEEESPELSDEDHDGADEVSVVCSPLADELAEAGTRQPLPAVGSPSLQAAAGPGGPHPWARFNNQNTVLRRAFFSVERAEHTAAVDYFAVMHESRIFYFEFPRAMPPAERDEFVDAVQEGILELLTTPKYRYLSSIYLLFRLGDKAMLLALVYCTLTGYVWQEELQQSLEIITVLTAEAA